MKVCMINAEWLPVPAVLGGAVESTLYETAVGVADPEMTVISPWSDRLADLPFEENTFLHVDVDDQARRVSEMMGDRAPRWDGRNRGLGKMFYYLAGVAELIDRIDPDVIQIHNRMEFVPFLVERFPDRQVYLYMHNEPTTSGIEVGASVGRIDRVIFVSDYLRRAFIRRFPNCDFAGSVIPNAVDTKKWHPDLRDFTKVRAVKERFNLSAGRTVLFVGRTVQEKGISHLIDAMAIVRRDIPDARLLIVGSPFYGVAHDSGYHRSLRRRAAKLGPGAVQFTGFVDREDTPLYYAAADVLVAPSVWPEPFGKVLIEGMASGLAVVGSRRGGIPEVLSHGKDGHLVDDPKNAREVADTIVALLGDETLRKRLGREARTTATRYYSIERRFGLLRDLYGRGPAADQAA